MHARHVSGQLSQYCSFGGVGWLRPPQPCISPDSPCFLWRRHCNSSVCEEDCPSTTMCLPTRQLLHCNFSVLRPSTSLSFTALRLSLGAAGFCVVWLMQPAEDQGNCIITGFPTPYKNTALNERRTIHLHIRTARRQI